MGSCIENYGRRCVEMAKRLHAACSSVCVCGSLVYEVVLESKAMSVIRRCAAFERKKGIESVYEVERARIALIRQFNKVFTPN